ncbi:MAG: DUF2721 domain-containing protein [Fibrobacterales bacterium]
MILTTPALLFPAISLLLLAYTNRFAITAQLIRQLHANGREKMSHIIDPQIENLRKRLNLIRVMQAFGITSFLCCTVSMLMLFTENISAGKYIFGLSLGLLCISLCISLWEIWISGDALKYELQDMENERDSEKKRRKDDVV